MTSGEARALRIAGLVLAVGLAVRVGAGMWEIAVPSQRLPYYDESSRGLTAVHLAHALGRGDLAGAWRVVDENLVWPPLFPVVVAPVFLVFGGTPDVAEATMTVCLLLLVLVTFAFGPLALGGSRGLLVGAIGATLVASSPYAQLLGGLLLLEVPGAALTLLALAGYARWRRLGNPRDLHLCGVAATLLFFTKYNYSILLVAPIALNELGHTLPSPRTWIASLRRRRPGPFWIVVLGWVAVLVFLSTRGGSWGYGVARGGGHGLRLAFLGLLALLLGRFLLRPGRHLRALREALGRLPAGVGGFLMVAGLPPLLWLADPSHLKSFVHFAVSRSGDASLHGIAGLMAYPGWFVTEYGPTPWLAVLALALAALSLGLLRGAPAELRIVPLAMLVGFALCAAHRFKSPRFFFTVAPLIWIAAALPLALALERATRRLGERRAETVTGAVACLVLLLGLILGFDAERARRRFEDFTVPASVGRVLDRVDEAQLGSRGTVLAGFWNGLSPAMVEWHTRLRHPEARPGLRPKNTEWYAAADATRLVEAIAADPEVERVLVLDLEPGGAAFDGSFVRENPWLPEARARLGRDPRFVVERRLEFTDSGYRLDVIRRRPGQGRPIASISSRSTAGSSWTGVQAASFSR